MPTPASRAMPRLQPDLPDPRRARSRSRWSSPDPAEYPGPGGRSTRPRRVSGGAGRRRPVPSRSTTTAANHCTPTATSSPTRRRRSAPWSAPTRPCAAASSRGLLAGRGREPRVRRRQASACCSASSSSPAIHPTESRSGMSSGRSLAGRLGVRHRPHLHRVQPYLHLRRQPGHREVHLHRQSRQCEWRGDLPLPRCRRAAYLANAPLPQRRLHRHRLCVHLERRRRPQAPRHHGPV